MPLMDVLEESMRTLSHAQVASESHGIDLAPMLHFVVNSIFFIITAVFVRQAGVESVARATVH